MIRWKGILQPETIMYRALHIGVMLAVSVHMVLGCCLHHAHAWGPRIDLPLSVDAACPCERHGHLHEGQPGDHDDKQRGCDEAPCTFTRPGSSGDGDLLAGLQCLPLISCLPPLSALSGIDTADLAPGRFGASIPLHLLNQALLL